MSRPPGTSRSDPTGDDSRGGGGYDNGMPRTASRTRPSQGSGAPLVHPEGGAPVGGPSRTNGPPSVDVGQGQPGGRAAQTADYPPYKSTARTDAVQAEPPAGAAKPVREPVAARVGGERAADGARAGEPARAAEPVREPVAATVGGERAVDGARAGEPVRAAESVREPVAAMVSAERSAGRGGPSAAGGQAPGLGARGAGGGSPSGRSGPAAGQPSGAGPRGGRGPGWSDVSSGAGRGRAGDAVTTQPISGLGSRGTGSQQAGPAGRAGQGVGGDQPHGPTTDPARTAALGPGRAADGPAPGRFDVDQMPRSRFGSRTGGHEAPPGAGPGDGPAGTGRSPDGSWGRDTDGPDLSVHGPSAGGHRQARRGRPHLSAAVTSLDLRRRDSL